MRGVAGSARAAVVGHRAALFATLDSCCCRLVGAMVCSLLSECIEMSAACCLLPAACCLLPAVCCLLPAACCLLSAACCLLSSIANSDCGRRGAAGRARCRVAPGADLVVPVGYLGSATGFAIRPEPGPGPGSGPPSTPDALPLMRPRGHPGYRHPPSPPPSNQRQTNSFIENSIEAGILLGGNATTSQH
jgi:hypothetical protein